MTDIEAGMPPSSSQASPYSRGYLARAMGLLFLVYTSNFLDSTILAVLQRPIKDELKLTDTELGLLGGFAFAALYSILGGMIGQHYALAARHLAGTWRRGGIGGATFRAPERL